MLDAIEGIERIRYTSPHPKDMREDVIRAHAELASVCEHIHLPLQSGSSRILKAMRRTYDRARYLDRVALIREHVPDAALTTDIIVGFPGETDEDFRETLEVVEEVGYDSAFTFIFSPRRGTEAAAHHRGAGAPPAEGGADGASWWSSSSARRASAPSASSGARWRCWWKAPRAPTPSACAGAPATTRSSTSPAWRAAGELTDVEILTATSQTLVRRGAPAGARVSGEERCQPMKIRAAVLEEFAKPLVVQEVELSEPGPREVLVRLVACGVCHTDMYTASGVDPSGYAPTVLGHEGAGVVERCGEGVSLVREGDHVVTLFSPQCGECVHCRSPLTNLCLAIREQQNLGYLPDGTTRLSRDGEPLRHFMGTSTFAEYTVMPEIALARIDPEAPLDRACLFACGLSTGLGAAMKTASVRAGSTCVVFGAGMVGLGAVAGCRLQGAERIVCVDLSPERLELARGQGATDVLIGGADAVATDPRDDRRLRCRLHLRGDRQRRGDAPGARGGAHGVGAVHGLRRGRPRRDARRRATPADHRQAGVRLLLRRPEGAR